MKLSGLCMQKELKNYFAQLQYENDKKRPRLKNTLQSGAQNMDYQKINYCGFLKEKYNLLIVKKIPDT